MLFGLNSAPFLFTKIIRPLVKYWCKHLIKIACFLSDSLSVAEFFSEAICSSQFVRKTLQKSGFIEKSEKSVSEPQEVMTWLGITLGLRVKIFHISNTRTESVLKTLNNLTNTPYVTASKVTQRIGKIISTIYVLGTIIILAQTSRDSHFSILYYHFEIEEITFWKQNIQTLNKRPLILYKLPIAKVYSDANNSEIGTCFEIKRENIISTKTFLAQKNVRVPHGENWKQYITPCALFLNNNSLFCSILTTSQPTKL